MKGQPPLQALLLLVALAIVGFAGKIYISTGQHVTRPEPEPVMAIGGEHFADCEIELVFSSLPQSYKLTRPAVGGGKDEVLLDVTKPEDNPDYRDLKLVAHRNATYWLDVIWPDTPDNGRHHLVRVHISPDHGEGGEYSFFTGSRSMNETFDYSTGEQHHE